jgi:hypothetical protein
MELPEPLARLAGRWTGPEDLAPSPWLPGGRAEATVVFAPGAGGAVLLEDYESVQDGRPLISGHGVLSFDAESGEVRLHWFDSLGFAAEAPARGRWSGDRLVLERHSPRGTNRTTWIAGADVLEQTVAFGAAGDDEFTTFARGRYTRA